MNQGKEERMEGLKWECRINRRLGEETTRFELQLVLISHAPAQESTNTKQRRLRHPPPKCPDPRYIMHQPLTCP